MKKRKCPECNGKGWVECITQEQSGYECSSSCPICGGSGRMPCPACGGDGTDEDNELY